MLPICFTLLFPRALPIMIPSTGFWSHRWCRRHRRRRGDAKPIANLCPGAERTFGAVATTYDAGD